jgi:hypothetical protein
MVGSDDRHAPVPERLSQSERRPPELRQLVEEQPEFSGSDLRAGESAQAPQPQRGGA